MLHALVAIGLLSCALPSATGEVYHVSDLAEPGGDGASWRTAFDTLDDALAVASSGDSVWVRTGVYRPRVEAEVRDATFLVPNGVAVLGGFAGWELDAVDRDPAANPVVLCGDLFATP